MKIQVMEVGNRPAIMTNARLYAPAGARVFGEMLAAAEFADFAFVVLDWENVMKRLPEEASYPVLYVQVHKLFPGLDGQNHLTVEERFDVDDVFGNDSMTAETVVLTVEAIRDKMVHESRRRLAN